jgi:hypothetical protein
LGKKNAQTPDYGFFSWEEKLVGPLIATPNVDRAIENKKE